MASRQRTSPLARSARAVSVAALALAALASPAFVPSAYAQTDGADQPSAADKETARSLMDAGADREDAKDFAAALKAYKGAHALVRFPMTGLAVARMQAALGQLVEALDTTAEIKLLPRHAGEGPAYAKARADAEALAEKVAARTPAVQVTVSFASGAAKDGAEVSIDGTVLPPAAASLPRKVNPGKHVVAVSLAGFEKATQEVTVLEGGTTPVTVTLTPVASAKGGPGNDGSGSKGHDGGSNNPIEPKKPAEGGLSPLVYAGFGVGAAGIIVGAITGGISISKTNELKPACPNGACGPEKTSDIESANTMANISNVTFALGAVGAVVGVVGLILPRGSRQDKPADAGHIQITPGLGGVLVTGTF